jgi:hypothetical protein
LHHPKSGKFGKFSHPDLRFGKDNRLVFAITGLQMSSFFSLNPIPNDPNEFLSVSPWYRVGQFMGLCGPDQATGQSRMADF